jgi:excisionase family DNA binding protein
MGTDRKLVVVVDVDELDQRIEAAVRRVLDTRAPTAPIEWLDSAGAAEILGVHRRTIANMARAGELPHTRLGKLLRFKRADVLAMLEKKKAG